jgi:1-deoxy-D-xylulose-5-phosphate reductoisomerase
MNDVTSPLPALPPLAPPPSAAGPRDVVLLGCTGSIGTQAVDVVRRNPERFRVVALAAGGHNLELLAGQAVELGVEAVAVSDPGAAGALRAALSRLDPAAAAGIEVLAGPDAAAELAQRPCDVVLNGITGAIGLAPTLAALRAGRVLALANKESLIMGGPLVTSVARPGQIVPSIRRWRSACAAAAPVRCGGWS